MTSEMYNIIGILVILATLFIAWKYFGKRKEVLSTIAYLVQVAEDKFGAGAGDIKYQYVAERIYPMLPDSIKFFFTDKQLDRWITQAVDNLQQKIEDKIEQS